MGIIPQLVRFTIQNYRAAVDNTAELAQSAEKQSNQLQHLQMMMVAPDQVSLSRYLVLMTIPGCEAVWVRADYGVGGVLFTHWEQKPKPQNKPQNIIFVF